MDLAKLFIVVQGIEQRYKDGLNTKIEAFKEMEQATTECRDTLLSVAKSEKRQAREAIKALGGDNNE